MNDNINQDTDYSRRGPWDAPLRTFVKEHTVIAVIHDIDKESIDYEIKLDLGNPDDKKFLGKITFWATSNGRSVETFAPQDWDKVKE